MRGHDQPKGSVGSSVTPSVPVNDMAPTGEKVPAPGSPARAQDGARGNDQPITPKAGPAESRPTSTPVVPTDANVKPGRASDVPSGNIPTNNGKL
jgi:hypothetical protein